jgi:putative membrane protein
MEEQVPVSVEAASPGQPSSEQLALMRTYMAQERTMMAWIRTGTSLISFGFSIYKFAEILEGRAARVLGPRLYGSAMILVGLSAIGLAAIDHRVNRLDLQHRGVAAPRSRATLVAWLVAVLGVLALGLIALRQ